MLVRMCRNKNIICYLWKFEMVKTLWKAFWQFLKW